MTSYKFKIPTFIEMGKNKKKKYYLNLNNYRNWHFIVSNNLKSKFEEVIKDQLPESICVDNKVDITYKLYSADNRRRDKGNVLCIVQKFLLDVLTNIGVWKDDNDNYIGNETFLESEKDENKEGYIEVIITERKYVEIFIQTINE